MPMGENGNSLVDPLDEPSDLQSVDRTDPTMPMGENGNRLVDPLDESSDLTSDEPIPATVQKSPRGAIGALVIELLVTEMPYEDIVKQVRETYPDAKTTARSIASVAMDLRRDGVNVPSRRKPAAEKPAKAPKPTQEG